MQSGGTLQTVPLGPPKKNIAHVYSTTTSGGTGEVVFTIPNPAPGVYAASFTANFFPAGTPSAPETFSCFITQNGSMRAQSTISTGYSSGFYAGVNGGNTIKLVTGDVLNLGCGTADGSAWTWGTQPVQATLTKLDGMTSGTVSAAAHKSSAASLHHALTIWTNLTWTRRRPLTATCPRRRVGLGWDYLRSRVPTRRPATTRPTVPIVSR